MELKLTDNTELKADQLIANSTMPAPKPMLPSGPNSAVQQLSNLIP